MGQLHDAAKAGDLEKVKQLIAAGILFSGPKDVNEKDWSNNTALIYAADRGHLEVVKYLLDKGAKLDEKSNNGNTALIFAVFKGHLEMVRCLVEKGAKLDGRAKDGNTELILAANKGHLEIVRYLVDKGAKLDEKNNDDNTALIIAADRGYLEMVRCLVEKGAKLDEKNKDGFTALIFAAQSGHLEVVRYLVDKGAKLDEKDRYGFTALIFAAQCGHLEMVRCLVEKGAKLDENNRGFIALMAAVERNNLEVVRYLVRQGAQWHIKNNEGESALDCAKKFRDERPQNKSKWQALVDYLSNEASKEWGMDVKKNISSEVSNITASSTLSHSNVSNINKVTQPVQLVQQPQRPSIQSISPATSLHDAARSGNLENIKGLIEKGGLILKDIDGKDDAGSTALILAADKGHFEVVRYLVEKGAKLDEKTKRGSTALSFAAFNGHLEIVRYLVDKDAKLNEKNKEGNTALIFAAQYGHLEIVRYLVRQGAQWDTKDNKGRSALDVAKQFRDKIPENKTQGQAIVDYLSNETSKEWGIDIKKNISSEISNTTASSTLSHSNISNDNNANVVNNKVTQPVQSVSLPIAQNPKITQPAQPSSTPTPQTPTVELSFTSQLEVIPYADLKIDTKLGEGAYGHVFKATHGHEEVAVKQLNMTGNDAKLLAQFESEANAMAKLHSRYTLKIVGICLEPYRCLVLEYMESGSLYDYLQKNPSSTMQWLKRIELALDIGKGLSYLHTRKVIHRDLKSLNVLLDEKQNAKIADFGLSTTKQHSQSGKTKSACGTTAWMAPELLDPDIDEYEYTPQTDIFAFAMVLYELSSHQTPFQGQKEAQIISKIQKGNRPTLPDNTPVAYVNLVGRCWAQESKQRPNADSAIAELNNLKQTEGTQKQTPQHASLFS